MVYWPRGWYQLPCISPITAASKGLFISFRPSVGPHNYQSMHVSRPCMVNYKLQIGEWKLLFKLEWHREAKSLNATGLFQFIDYRHYRLYQDDVIWWQGFFFAYGWVIWSARALRKGSILRARRRLMNQLWNHFSNNFWKIVLVFYLEGQGHLFLVSLWIEKRISFNGIVKIMVEIC